jgi:hypothetical protein
MNLEIQKPELVQRVNAHIQAGASTTRTSLSKKLGKLSKRRPPLRRRPSAEKSGGAEEPG